MRAETVCRRPDPSTWVIAGMAARFSSRIWNSLHHEWDRAILLEHLLAPTARMVETTPAA